jgi:radical SAM protein with 4Fe4S-binding SPASM domain
MRVIFVRNLIKTLTLRRLWNLICIFVSFRISLLRKKSVVWGRPFSVTIEPTNVCNLRCPECPSGNGSMIRTSGFMDLQSFTRIVDELSTEVWYLQLFFQGEPFLHRDLIRMIAYARSKKMFVSVSTNAHFIDRATADELVSSGLNRLIISLDGASEESYTKYRIGGRITKVLDGLNQLKNARDETRNQTTEVILQTLVTKFNEHELPRMREIAEECDARLSLKSMQVYSVNSAEIFLPADGRYRRYILDGNRLQIKSSLINRCSSLWIKSVITWDGRVVPCCFDKDAEYSFGSLATESFRSIWNSEQFHQFRNRILHNRKGIPMCTNCTEGLRTRLT